MITKLTARSACLLLLLASSLAAAEPAAPKPPAEYAVFIRYQIDAFRNEHVAQFDQMLATFKAMGFQKVSDFEDERESRAINRMIGNIPSPNARKLLTERHVRTVLLFPKDAKLPEDPDQLMRLQIDLHAGTDPVRQQLLADQVRNVLAALGFREATAYDHRGHTRLVGMIALGRLETLLGDLRWFPASTALLKPTLLSDLCKSRAGEDLLQTILIDIIRHPEGKKLVQAILNDRQERPTPEELLFKLNPEIARNPNLLVKLFEDIRQGPAGSELLRVIFGHIDRSPFRSELPFLYSSSSPVRLVEVMAGQEPTAARPAPAPIPKGMENIAPDLRALLSNKDEAAKPIRMEVILASAPGPEDRLWYRLLRQTAPALAIDGRVGPLVSVTGPATHAIDLVALPIVTAVRLPTSARPQLQDAAPPVGDLKEALRASGLERLHQLGHRGKGIRVAVVDGDFRGWQALAGKQLPAGTTMVDLTRARNRDVEPDPTPGDPKAIGHGSRCAMLLLQAAPEADLVLIRVDPAAPYQLQEAARFINGEEVRSLSLDTRTDELEENFQFLERIRQTLLEERKFLLTSVDDAEEFKKKWQAYKKKQDELDQAEKDLNGRMNRLLQLRRDLRGLRGIAVVACPLVWNEGHPVDGTSALSRYFDDRPFKAAIWFQSAGNTRGQAWTGLFRDTDGNGVMEFVAGGTPLPEGRWTPEINFLGWQTGPGARPTNPEIPEKTRLRVSIQWREAHDPDLARNGEDAFRVPLALLRIVVLRQRDPSGTKLPADDFEVVAQSFGLPQRLDNQPSAGTYEQSVEFTTPVAGRYVIRIEGQAPVGTRPVSAPTIPAAHRSGELRSRVFVETLSSPGRAIFAIFTTDHPRRGIDGGSLGMPADSRQVITVGAADRTGQPQAFSALGPPLNLDLLIKPDVLAFDIPAPEDSAHGTSLSTSFAAGMAASALSAGAPRTKFLETMQVQPGSVLRIPQNWPLRGR